MSGAVQVKRWTKKHREDARQQFVESGIDVPRHHARCFAAQQKLAVLEWPEPVKNWIHRAFHERHCLDHSAGVAAETCPSCLRPVAGSFGGTGQGESCWCTDDFVTVTMLAPRHGLELFWTSDEIERGTGKVVGA